MTSYSLAVLGRRGGGNGGVRLGISHDASLAQHERLFAIFRSKSQVERAARVVRHWELLLG